MQRLQELEDIWVITGTRAPTATDSPNSVPTWENLSKQFESLSRQFGAKECCSRDVTARLSETLDQTGCDRISADRHNDGKNRAGLLCRRRSWGSVRDQAVEFETGKFGGELRKALIVAFGPAKFDGEIFTLDVAVCAQAILQCSDELCVL